MATARSSDSSLARRAGVIRPGRPVVRTTYQLAATIDCLPKKSVADTLLDAERVVLKWLGSKMPGPIPSSALGGHSFAIEEHGQSLSVVGIPEAGIWSSRLIQPDAPFKDRMAVPGRTWTTELSLAIDGDRVRLVIRILCASLPYANSPVEFTRPRTVLDLAERFVLRDARRITSEAWFLKTEQDLADFQAVLVDPKRKLPVYLLTQPEPLKVGMPVSDYLLDPSALARKLQGVGFVVAIPRALNPTWTASVGRLWSAFMGAVRTYRPGLSFEIDSPTSHPLALVDSILRFEKDGLRSEDAFTAFLVEKAYLYAATKTLEWQPCLTYAAALQREADFASARAQKDGDVVASLRTQLAAQKKQADDWEGLATGYAKDAESFEDQLTASANENRTLRNYIGTLRAQLEGKTGRSPDANLAIPTSFEEMPGWVETNLAGRLTLHPRAVRGIKDAVYKDVVLVYRALLCLAQEYRNMRLRTADDEAPRLAWEKKLKDLELKCDGSITKERAGEQGDTYFVKYPVGSATNRFMELHLRKGKIKDDQLCLAIYFFWDEEREQVVVGWLPSHLENRMT